MSHHPSILAALFSRTLRRTARFTRCAPRLEALEHRRALATVSRGGGYEGADVDLELESEKGSTIEYSYEHYGIPDNFIIRYEGKTLLETGFVSGSRSGTVTVPGGKSKKASIIVATNDQGTAWNFTATSTSCPDTKPFTVEMAGGADFQHDEKTGKCIGTGTIYIGRTDGITHMLRVEGTVEFDTSGMKVNGTVFSMIGAGQVLSMPLFTGAFEISFASSSATSFSESPSAGEYTLGGMDVDFTGISIYPNSISLGARFELLDGLGTPSHIFSGSDGLLITAQDVEIGGSIKASLPSFKDFTLFDFVPIKEFSDFSIEYMANTDTLKIQGKLVVDVSSKPRSGEVTANLAGENYVQLQGGKWDIRGDLTVQTDLTFPPKGWGLRELKIFLDTAKQDVTGSAKLTLPIGRTVSVTGEVGFKTPIPPLELNKLGLSVDNLNMPIPAWPGTFFQGFNGAVENFAASDSDPIEFSGNVVATLGPQVLGISAIRAEVGGKVSSESLTGTGRVTIVNDKLFTANGAVTLDWEKKLFQTTGSITILDGLVVTNDSFKVTSTFDVSIGGAATIGIPKSVPMFGGAQIAGGNYLFEFSNDGNLSNDFAAGWGTIRVQKLGFDQTFVIGFKGYFDGRLERIGAKSIPPTGSWDFAAGLPWAIISADWEIDSDSDVPVRIRTPDGTWIEEADFDAHGIAIVDELTDSTTKTVIIFNPVAGHWDFKVVDETGRGTVTYHAAEESPSPTISVTAPASVVAGGTVAIGYHAVDPDSTAEIHLFYDTDTRDFDGSRIIAGLVEQDGDGTYSWNTTGLPVGTYHVYAMVTDGDNPPVFAYAPGAIHVTDAADLVATVSAGDDPIRPGDRLSYTFTVTNAGPAVSVGVMATATLPATRIDVDADAPYSAEPVTPTFEDIRDTGAQVLANRDDSVAEIQLPFSFTLYDGSYTTAYVSTNGLITFGSPESSYSNGNLTGSPSSATIAVFWDDQATGSDGVFWEVRGDIGSQRLIVQWQNASYLSGGASTLRYQATLFEQDSRILFNYDNLATGANGHDEGASATVGIKNAGTASGANVLLLSNGNGPNAFVGSNKSTSITVRPQRDVYALSLSPGDQLVVMTTTPEGNLDPALEVIAPDGNSLATDTDGADDRRNARIAFTADQAGLYRVAVTSERGTVGTYALQAAFAVGTLANAASRSFVVSPEESVSEGMFASRLEVNGSSYDPDSSNSVAERLTLVTREQQQVSPASLAVSGSSITTPSLRNDYTYERTVRNTGTVPATNVVLTEYLPIGSATYLGNQASQGTTTFQGNSLVTNFGTLAAGAAATLRITVSPFAAGNMISSARVAADQPDPDLRDNTLITSVPIAPAPPQPADLSLSVTTSDDSPSIGDEVTITVRVHNAGPGIASGVVIHSLLQAGSLRLVSASPDQGTYDPKTGLWDVGNIRDNLGRNLALRARVLTGNRITPVAEIRSVNESDPDSTPHNGNTTEDDRAVTTIVPNIAKRDAYGFSSGDILKIPARSGVLANDFKIAGRKAKAILVNDVTNGSLVLKPDGGFVYTPAAGFAGLDSFVYKSIDQTGFTSNEQTVVLGTQLVSLKSDTLKIGEATDTGTVSLELFRPAASELSIPYVVISKTASGFGTDFTLANGTVVFPVGATSRTVSFTVNNDVLDEADEDFQIVLGAMPAGVARGTRDVATVTVIDNDTPPTVGFATKTGTTVEGGDGGFSIVLNKASGQPVTVTFAVSGTAKIGTDLSLDTRQVTFQPGETNRFVSIPTIDDAVHEASETLSIILTKASNATILPTSKTFTSTITDNDAPPVVQFVTGATTSRVETGTVAMLVTLSARSSFSISVAYSVTGGTAKSGADFVLGKGTLRFKPGETSQTITLAVKADKASEPDETVFVGLTAPTHATLGSRVTHTVTIVDDDADTSAVRSAITHSRFGLLGRSRWR